MLDCVTEIPLPGRMFAPPNATSQTSVPRDPLPAFVAGPENRLVASAMRTLIESAAANDDDESAKQRLSPILVLFGASGTGKTHLACGLVRHWQTQCGEASAVYTTAADFRHLLHDAIKRQAELEFRAQFRRRQLLVIEDLQHLPADDFALQELRYTLDDYDARGGTVVVTSTEPVATLPNLPADVRSRLACGLLLQVAEPGEAARLRIVRHAVAALRQPLSDDAAERLAHGIQGPANSLFQAVFELFAPTGGRPLTDSARTERVLASRRARKPTLREIMALVARQQGVPQAQLKSSSRRQSIVLARGLVTFLARELCGTSYEELGRALGGRDHTTIMHSYQKITAERETSPQLQQTLVQLRRLLTAR